MKLSDIETQKVFYDKLTFIYLSMPKFNKHIEELEGRFEKWLYVIKNLHKLEEIPHKLQEKIFLQLFKTAEIANFTKKEHQAYEESLKHYRDLESTLDTAKEEGRKEGRIEGRREGIVEGEQLGKKKRSIEIARNLLDVLDTETIAQKTGLTIEEINNLK